jgi:hypothetical protein
MKNRIEERVTQVGIKFDTHPQHWDKSTAVITQSDLKKLTELIIEDCVYAVTNAKCSQVSTTWDRSFAEYIKSCCTGAIHEVFHDTIV